MKLEELQRIWNEQKGETMYAINERALHNHITNKKDALSRKISIVEISLMAINSAVGAILFADAILDREGIWDYTFSMVMLLTVLFLALFRRNRLRQEKTFDRSMLGELDHAISNADSLLRIATIMLYYYLIPIGLFSIAKMAVLGASIEKWLLVMGAYTLAFFVVHYERKVCHYPRRRRLEQLKEKLRSE